MWKYFDFSTVIFGMYSKKYSIFNRFLTSWHFDRSLYGNYVIDNVENEQKESSESDLEGKKF